MNAATPSPHALGLIKPGDPRFTALIPPILSENAETNPKKLAETGKDTLGSGSGLQGRPDDTAHGICCDDVSDSITVQSLPASVTDAPSTSVKTRSTSHERILPRDLAFYTPSIHFNAFNCSEDPDVVKKLVAKFDDIIFGHAIIPRSLQVWVSTLSGMKILTTRSPSSKLNILDLALPALVTTEMLQLPPMRSRHRFYGGRLHQYWPQLLDVGRSIPMRMTGEMRLSVPPSP